MSVVISESGGKMRVLAPYHPSFPARAKALGGRWSARARTWEFDVRDSDAVRAMLLSVYGTNGVEVAGGELVSMLLRLSRAELDVQEVWRLGRQVLARRGRDEAVTFGPGVRLHSGGPLPTSGGSRAHPRIGCLWGAAGVGVASGVVLLVRDVPRGLAELDCGAEIIEE